MCIRYAMLLEKLTSIAVATHSHNVQLLLGPFVQIARSEMKKVWSQLCCTLHGQEGNESYLTKVMCTPSLL